jgi:hypothetical protein
MNKKINFLFILFSFNCISIQLDTYVGVGQAWNSIVALEQFRIIESGLQAKETLHLTDNNGPWFEGNFKFGLWDNFFFINWFLEGGFERKGVGSFNQSIQEGSFDVLTDVNGQLSANLFSTEIGIGKDFKIRDYFKLTLGTGFQYFKGYRRLDFLSDSRALVINDDLKAGYMSVSATTLLTDKVSLTTSFYSAFGPLSANFEISPTDSITNVLYKKTIMYAIKLIGMYNCNERWALGVKAKWAIAQNREPGIVTLSAADALLYDSSSVPFYRSSFFLLTFLLSYSC